METAEKGHDAAVEKLLAPGADRQGIELRSRDQWDALIDPKDGELAEIGPMLQRLRKRGKRVYVSINNHHEGSAPLTADKLRALLA